MWVEFFRLGLTSFGGPVAHLGFFRQRFVNELKWLTDAQYAELVALCQVLPGPASSQVGMGLGLMRAGRRGALAAWAGFTLPSALALVILAWGLTQHAGNVPAVWLHGLKLAAAAVVTQAVWGMARTLCPDASRRLLAVGVLVGVVVWPHPASQIGALVLAGLVWAKWGPTPAATSASPLPVGLSRREGLAWGLALAALLVGLPWAMTWTPNLALAVADVFVRVGALVFGGGHVVLPLLQAEVVPNGWVTDAQFMAGYGATQAMPGPLFTFAAYLGATLAPLASDGTGGSWAALAGATVWGLLALVAIFLPAWMVLAAALPFWNRWQSHPVMAGAMAGVGAAVVGLLAAAWWNPVLPAALAHPSDAVWLLVLVTLLLRTRTPVWGVVPLACVMAWLSQLLG